MIVKKVGELWMATGMTPVYSINYNGEKFGFYRTYTGAPACVATVEEVPTAAYRDEGSSYHYVPASDYIAVKNAKIVATCTEENKIPYVYGKTWTTDAAEIIQLINGVSVCSMENTSTSTEVLEDRSSLVKFQKGVYRYYG